MPRSAEGGDEACGFIRAGFDTRFSLDPFIPVIDNILADAVKCFGARRQGTHLLIAHFGQWYSGGATAFGKLDVEAEVERLNDEADLPNNRVASLQA